MMWLFVILILLGSCSAPEVDTSTPLPNATIAEVRTMAEAGYREVECDAVIMGRVVSSDSTGNRLAPYIELVLGRIQYAATFA